MPPGLQYEQFQELKALAADMLSAQGQLFNIHWAGCACSVCLTPRLCSVLDLASEGNLIRHVVCHSTCTHAG